MTDLTVRNDVVGPNEIEIVDFLLRSAALARKAGSTTGCQTLRPVTFFFFAVII
jgi:hypothetical protein